MPSWDFQRAVAAVILGVTHEDGFALAGSGAIREHGLTDRPTQDVDLFTMNITEARFADAVDHAMAALSEHGYDASRTRSAPLFARLIVTRGDEQLEVDLGVDWRGHDPIRFDIGPVLAIDDAVANKVGAVYSRAAARDFLDVDSIRQSDRFTDPELLRLAAEHDPGFDNATFADQLALVSTVGSGSVADYGITPESLDGIKNRLLAWRDRIVNNLMSRPNHDVWETIEHRPVHRPDPPGHHRRPPDRGVPI
ncbi:MAG: nucleotidyl transferase AbiEii/AbiGii toxin family protein [Micropruina sp.]|nr:nucleotidyl transferase AbiEii/AbiGii toxin family protein [Micropruina sp.]